MGVGMSKDSSIFGPQVKVEGYRLTDGGCGKVINYSPGIPIFVEEVDDHEYKLSCLIDRLTGGRYSKPSMTVDEIMYEHESWHERQEGNDG
jgi:hypothetical protein